MDQFNMGGGRQRRHMGAHRALGDDICHGSQQQENRKPKRSTANQQENTQANQNYRKQNKHHQGSINLRPKQKKTVPKKSKEHTKRAETTGHRKRSSQAAKTVT